MAKTGPRWIPTMKEVTARSAAITAKLGVSVHRAKTGAARPDISAGAQSFQRSSRRLNRSTTMPPASVPAMPARPFKVPA